MLIWTAEEKALRNIKKIIIRVWRMNHAQLYTFYKKLQKNSKELLPGQIGCAFLKVLQQIALEEETSAKVWTQLMRDADNLLNLIQKQRRAKEQAWLAALRRLEAQPDRAFQTELGRAFVQSLKVKLGIDSSQELEQIADWLMNEPKQPSGKKRSPALLFACLSACFMGIWMYGQIERNQNQWELQQMKVFASKEADMYLADSPAARQDTAARRQAQPDTAAGKASRIKNEAAANKTTAAENIRQGKSENAAGRQKKLPQYEQMSKEYPDLFGWLSIPKTQIDAPVMQPQKESDFYLSHDFKGSASVEGALFVDAKNSLMHQDHNTVIYGHNMKNGHMFGTLDLYKNADYFQAHKKIHFDTIYETGIYEAVAVVKTRILQEEEPGFRYYQFFEYDDQQSFQACQDFVKANQLFDAGSSLQYGDQILMLSTCEYSQENGRLVLVARKVG